jgi:predicted N-acetyltransferase YhbS
MLEIGPIPRDRYDAVDTLYDRVGYGGKPAADDLVIGAHVDGTLVGVLRLTEEHGLTVLRGMQVDAPFQRQGVGSELLAAAGQALGSRECWCVPHLHLRAFYTKIGFEERPAADAPDFLADRWRRYTESGLGVALMRRTAGLPEM